MMRELATVYRRLRDTLKKNKLETRHRGRAGEDLDNELYRSDTLARAVGFSISAVEIQQRGTDAEYGMTLLEKIPAQVLTHLRILSETVTSYLTVGGQRFGGDNLVESEYRCDSERQHCQMFMAQYIGEETEHARRPADAYPPLLSSDPFIFLSECVFGVIPAQEFEISHMMRLCYLAEIAKAVYHMGRNMPIRTYAANLINRTEDGAALNNFADFCVCMVHADVTVRTPTGSVMDTSILSTDVVGNHEGFAQEGTDSLQGYYSFVKKYALAFLRKCVVLLYVRYGVDFNSRVLPDARAGRAGPAHRDAEAPVLRRDVHGPDTPRASIWLAQARDQPPCRRLDPPRHAAQPQAQPPAALGHAEPSSHLRARRPAQELRPPHRGMLPQAVPLNRTGPLGSPHLSHVRCPVLRPGHLLPQGRQGVEHGPPKKIGGVQQHMRK